MEETNNSTTLADDGAKLVVVARDRTGYPVIQQFLNKVNIYFYRLKLPATPNPPS
mgnify:FL=1